MPHPDSPVAIMSDSDAVAVRNWLSPHSVEDQYAFHVSVLPGFKTLRLTLNRLLIATLYFEHDSSIRTG
jgi:hypothetical protein